MADRIVGNIGRMVSSRVKGGAGWVSVRVSGNVKRRRGSNPDPRK